MDMELCQLDKIYVSELAGYKKVLDQRNNLLRQISFDKSKLDMLSVWNDQLVKYGIENQTTQTGPHRDDIIFLVNDMDVRRFGSQGQQRTVALSLKLAEIKLVKKIINDNPILLLDDVMSELDRSRQDALLDSIKEIQTILTCTGYDDFIKERLKINKVYKVTAGTIEEKTLC